MKHFFIACLLLATIAVKAQRKEIPLNDNWLFRFAWQVERGSEKRVDLPHTWNAQDALAGRADYYRGIGNYRKRLYVPNEFQGKRLYLRFEGANTVTNLFVNRQHVGEHRGGYGAFVFEITHAVTYGQENELLVKVNNAHQLDVMPLVGDFNIYGGIYRPVALIVTERQHISVTDYASPGVYLLQENVSKEQATVKARVMLSNSMPPGPAELCITVYNNNRPIVQKSRPITLSAADNQSGDISFTIHRPRLWNGRKDPFCYRAVVELKINSRVVDRVEQPLGLRFFRVEAEGFILNGEHLQLKGVCRHQDRAQVGSALVGEHHDEDMAMAVEIGANALRLAHYPQADYFYHLADRYGMVVWAEIPFIGPGGYMDRGYVNQPSFKQNGRQQLIELIRQNFNHPSICFWGIYNELKTEGDNPARYIATLDSLAHREDPSRLTVAASFLDNDNPLNAITNLIAWNKYYGWYGGDFADMGTWADHLHSAFPHYRLAISEYGAGGSVLHQQDSIKAGSPSGWWHPENWQTAYHIASWQTIAQRPFIWGSFVWNLFDFGAAHRTEGDRPGVNDKGLVTFDRKTKKDAFYFYKANWNRTEPFVYIAQRRHVFRTDSIIGVMAFTNLPSAVLYINDIRISEQKADTYAVCRWENVSLRQGSNAIKIVTDPNNPFSPADSVQWHLSGY